MRPLEHQAGVPGFSPVEHLLSEAAGWEPDVPAPEGLAARALAFELERQERERTLRARERRAGLFATLFLGASAVSATVALAFFHLGSRLPRETQPGGRVAKAAGEAARPAHKNAPERRMTPATPVRTAQNTPVRAGRRLAGTRAVRNRVKRSGAEIPVAVWREETVRRDVAGLLSTGWLIHQNPEDGSLSITPGVLEIQAGSPAACEEPAEGATGGETAPAPPAPETPATPSAEMETLNPPASAAPPSEMTGGAREPGS